jgi:hypothetical protein
MGSGHATSPYSADVESDATTTTSPYSADVDADGTSP